MEYRDGMYFRNADEADEWLEFDADGEDREQYAYQYPDQYAEWARWREASESS